MTSLILMKMEMNYESSILVTPTKGKNFPYLDNERFPDKMQLFKKIRRVILGPHANFYKNPMDRKKSYSIILICSKSIFCGNFLLADRARGPTLPSLFLVVDTRPSRGHYGVDFFGSFIFIAAAPRPLRLRRGFVVTTVPLIHKGAVLH